MSPDHRLVFETERLAVRIAIVGDYTTSVHHYMYRVDRADWERDRNE